MVTTRNTPAPISLEQGQNLGGSGTPNTLGSRLAETFKERYKRTRVLIIEKRKKENRVRKLEAMKLELTEGILVNPVFIEGVAYTG
jgi:hypothetical protein